MDLFKTIADWIVAQLHGFWVWLVSQIHVPPPPAWLVDAAGQVGLVMDYAGQAGHWIPWPVIVTVSLAVLACVVVAFVVQIVRIVASFATLGGGGT